MQLRHFVKQAIKTSESIEAAIEKVAQGLVDGSCSHSKRFETLDDAMSYAMKAVVKHYSMGSKLLTPEMRQSQFVIHAIEASDSNEAAIEKVAQGLVDGSCPHSKRFEALEDAKSYAKKAVVKTRAELKMTADPLNSITRQSQFVIRAIITSESIRAAVEKVTQGLVDGSCPHSRRFETPKDAKRYARAVVKNYAVGNQVMIAIMRQNFVIQAIKTSESNEAAVEKVAQGLIYGSCPHSKHYETLEESMSYAKCLVKNYSPNS